MSWTTLKISDTPMVEGVKVVRSALTPIFIPLETIMSIAAVVAETAGLLLIDISDVEAIAIKAAITAVRTVLEDLTQEMGCYFLPVPIRRLDLPPPGPVVLGEPGENQVIIELPSSLTKEGSGGNAGFLAEVADSLADTDDVLRPQFDEETYVGGIVVVCGATLYMDLIQLVKKLIQLFSESDKKSGVGEGLDDSFLPYPKNLRASIVPAAIGQMARLENRIAGGESRLYSVKLEWDPDDKFYNLYEMGGLDVEIKEVVVYRSTTRLSPTMPSSKLQEAELTRIEFDGSFETFYDDSTDPGNTYFYALGFIFKWEDAGGEHEHTNPPEVSTISIDIPEHIEFYPRSGTPPDWLVAPGPLSFIPGIGRFLSKLNDFLDALEKRTEGSNDAMKEYIETIQSEVDRYSGIMTEIIDTIEGIIDALTWPEVYIAATTFSGKGGNSFFLQELGKALTDTSDSNRPPFDRGTEPVCGFVMYAGATTASSIRNFMSMLEFLFQPVGERAQSALQEAMDTLNYVDETLTREIQLEKDLETQIAGLPEEIPPEKPLGPDLESAEESAQCNQGS